MYTHSFRVPSTERSTVPATASGAIAATSAAIMSAGTPSRANRAATNPDSRAGSVRTSRAGITSESNDCSHTATNTGCRPIRTEFTYQSPSAVVARDDASPVVGS